MIDNLKWIKEGEIEILYCDLRNLKDETLIPILKELLKTIPEMGRNDLLLIFDVTNSFFNRDSFSLAVELGKAIKPYRLKSAFVGVTGAKNFLLNSILTVTNTRDFVQTFKDVEAAKTWLLK